MAGLPVDVEGYREYVAARLEPLRRTAYLLCGDWHTADDLVSTALVKLLRHWRRVSAMDSPDAYVRRTLLRAWLDERRRPWRREAAWAEVPDSVVRPVAEETAERITVLALLAELPPRRRAVLVSRADGTSVMLMTNNQTPQPGSGVRVISAPQPLLDMAQLVRLGQAPGLTVYP
ncbi:sigma factor [Micromonospora sp. NPDC006766]|uniref:sigma factor n=1 Tax=Micromonospora sp. NPDC006766 TaxID=3154778 RepID=UPI0033F37918